MRRHAYDFIQKVVALRQKERYSYALLSRKVGIPSSTVRNWCVGLDKGSKWDTLIRSNERKRQEFRAADKYVVKKYDLSDTTKAKLMVALLYWCEGSKYPSSTAVTMVNSDPELLRTFICLLRRAYELDESKFHVHVQIHTTHDFEKVREYWSNVLQIEPSRFIKPTITKPNGKKHRSEYLGTCTVKYQDYRLLLKLMGIYDAFAKKVSDNSN